MKRARRKRGTGRVWQPKGSSVYMAKWYEGGVPIVRTTGKTTFNEAASWVKDKLKEVSGGEETPPADLTVQTFADNYFAALQVDGAKDYERTKARYENHIQPVFGRLKPSQVGPSLVRRYINDRVAAKAENGTINREVAILQRMFNQAKEEEKIKIVPYFPRVAENNVRTGFVEDDQHAALAEQTGKIGLWMRTIFEVGYQIGWRENEVVGLRVNQIDLVHHIIRLNPGETKNDDGRTVKMTPTLLALLTPCISGKQPEAAVFTRDDKSEVKDFRKAWWSCCCAAGLGKMVCRKCGEVVSDAACNKCGTSLHKGTLKYEGLLYHDLRRTAVRNMVRRGVPEKVAMLISGHKTRSVFDRYHIVSERDLADAAAKIEAGMNGYSTGTGTPSEPKTGEALNLNVH